MAKEHESPEILPSPEDIFHDFAGLCILHGELKQADELNGNEFVLKEGPLQSTTGIEEITYRPSYFTEGEQTGNSLEIIWGDDEIRKIFFWLDNNAGKIIYADVIMDPINEPQTVAETDQSNEEGTSGLSDQQKQEQFNEALTNIFFQVDADNEESQRIQDRLSAVLGDNSPSLADYMMLQQARSRYKKWFET